MYKRLTGVFEYFAFHHLEVNIPARRIEDDQGALIGYLEKLSVKPSSIYLRGWTLADSLNIRLGNEHWTRTPSIERNDVTAAQGCNSNVGFEIRLPKIDASEIAIAFINDGKRTELGVRMPGTKEFARARRRLWRRYLWRMLQVSPTIVTGTLRKDPTLRRRVKMALDLLEYDSSATLEAAELEKVSALPRPPETASVTVIVPVHNAFELVQVCLQRITEHTDIPWRLIVIEDASTDNRVRPWLRDWVRGQQEAGCEIHLLENSENLGFIRSVNKGFETALGFESPVVLLNSDALVPKGWASRLLEPIWNDGSRVATATPMSNDAEIFGAPVMCVSTPLLTGQADAMDAVIQTFSGPPQPVVAPTGVGFCMAINLNYLQRCPSFDAAFGRGYGEEVDWCQKTAAQGGLHVAVPNLFVEHRGGASFGSDEKWRRIAQNNALIARRYPKYDPMVQRFIANDPLVTPRLALALAYLDSLDDLHETPVFIAHTMGGGAENYLKARLEALSPAAAVILRFGGAARCQVEVLTPNGTTTGQTNDLDAVERLMQVLNRRRIIYSCAVGDPDPVELPDFFARVAQDQHLDVLFHDYFPISPSYTLLNRDGTYRGVPPPSSDDSAHCSRRMDGTKVSLEEWRHAWGKLMQQADRVIVFSKDSRALAISAYPETRHRIEVHPHKLTKLVPKVAPPQNDRTVIGVLGNIGPQKGAAVLQAASRLLRDTPNAELVLLGRIDPAFRLSSGTICHGNYDLEDIPFLIRRYGINIWFIPSIWPETFSYTTHESLATGLPVISFDLGAQGEAVTAAPNGHIVPMKGARSDTASLAARVIQTAIALRAQTG